MRTKLKQFRVRAGLTQAKLAKKVGVTQPNYQRWEAGSAPIPEDKLRKLAKTLETSPDALLGRHPPVEVRLYDDSAADDLNYYGEVAIHFSGGGRRCCCRFLNKNLAISIASSGKSDVCHRKKSRKSDGDY